MAATNPPADADAYGRTRDEFDDPVLVPKSVSSKGRVHEPEADRPRPQCNHGSRSNVSWQFEERSDVDHLENCSVCRGDVEPITHEGNFKDCPFCDESVKAVNWAGHIRKCAP